MILNNSEYDEQVMQQIAKESETFRIILESLIKDTDKEYPTNQAWLGTLSPSKNNKHTQVKLVVTQDINNIIDEN